MRTLALRVFRQLGRTRYAQSKPLLGSLLFTLWRYLRASTPEEGESAVHALAMSRFNRYPILFHDRHDLEYILYPDENAEVFLEKDGNYEVGEAAFCLSRLRPGMIAFDAGANIGLYTLLFAKAVGPAGCVHAFEPEPRNYRRLRINLAINGFENVNVNHAAVFARDGPVTLNVYPAGYHALHSLGRPNVSDLNRPGQIVQPEQSLSVPGVTLDDYCARHGIERIDYLKVDVEGAELAALQGARDLLKRGAIDVVQFEVSLPQVKAFGHSPEEIFEFLRGFGYRCHTIGANGRLGAETKSASAEYVNYAAVSVSV